MVQELDLVDRALQSLGAQPWPGDPYNIELEKRLMRAFESNRRVSPMKRHPFLAASLAILVLASVGFAAAGGVELVRGWFTVTVEVDGEVVATEEVALDEHGQATIAFPAEALAEGGELSLTMEQAEITGEDVGEGGTATISADLEVDDEVAELRLQVDVDSGEE